MVCPQQQAVETKASFWQSKEPPRQEEEGSAKGSAQAAHRGDCLAALSIMGHPHQISGLGKEEQEAPTLAAVSYTHLTLPTIYSV